MKKFSFLALLVVLSMILAACAGGGDTTPTSAAGGDTGLGTSEPLGTDVVETEPVMETEAPLFTETAPAAGGIGDSTAMPTQGAAVGTGIPATGGENDMYRLRSLMDFNVVTSDDEDMGEVDEMVLSVNDSSIEYVVVGVGGFLGIGERNVLIPWSNLTVGTTAGDNAFVFNGTRDMIENAPDVDLNDIDFTDDAWDAELSSYWMNSGSGGGTSVEGTPAVSGTAVATADAGMDSALQPTGQAGSDAGANMIMAGTDAGFVLASELLDAEVMDEANYQAGGAGTGTGTGVGTPVGDTGMLEPTTSAPQVGGENTMVTPGVGGATQPAAGGVGAMDNELGSVEDVIVDPQTGEIDYLVVDADDALDAVDGWILVPLDQVQVVYDDDDANTHSVDILADRERMIGAPTFDVDALPDLSTPGWDDELNTYWGISS